MLCLHRCGRTKEALEAYQELCSVLDKELGVGPNAALRALHRAVLANDMCAPPPAHVSVRTAQGRPPWRGMRPHVTVLGRDRERAELAELVLKERLVTVTGPGGCGKSTLALDTAREVAEAFPHGVTVVAKGLTALSRLVTLLDSAPAGDVGEASAAGPAGRSLVVLDDFDPFDSAAVAQVRRLLGHPEPVLLATSRAPLRISGEVVRPLSPLPTPIADEETAATRLFLSRAAQTMSRQAAPDDHALAARICRRLDGLPLALELAAARLRVLSLRTLADRLDGSLDCLLEPSRSVGPTRARLARGRPTTLTSVFEPSYARLDEAERLLLQRLSVLPGASFRLEDVEGRTKAPSRPPLSPSCVVPLLASLVEQSMVQAWDTSHGRHFRVLNPVRAVVTHASRASAESLEAA